MNPHIETFILRDKYNWSIDLIIQEAWAAATRRCDIMFLNLYDVAVLPNPKRLKTGITKWRIQMLVSPSTAPTLLEKYNKY
jgi:hypothetical protein